MSDQSFETWQDNLRESLQAFTYPPTPDIAGTLARRVGKAHLKERARRLAWAAALAIILVLAALMSVPPVRAAILEFLQIGAIRIFLVSPSPTPTPDSSTSIKPPASTPLPTLHLTPIPTDIVSLLDLAGETTMDEAVQRAGFDLHIPTYPDDLRMPQHVFLQDMDGAVVAFVWIEPAQSEEVRLSLFQIGPGSWAGEKGIPQVVEATRVNGQSALWTQGPYPLVLRNGSLEFRRLVNGNVLIWSADGITYRLEGIFTIDEAVKIAESLAPIP